MDSSQTSGRTSSPSWRDSARPLSRVDRLASASASTCGSTSSSRADTPLSSPRSSGKKYVPPNKRRGGYSASSTPTPTSSRKPGSHLPHRPAKQRSSLMPPPAQTPAAPAPATARRYAVMPGVLPQPQPQHVPRMQGLPPPGMMMRPMPVYVPNPQMQQAHVQMPVGYMAPAMYNNANRYIPAIVPAPEPKTRADVQASAKAPYDKKLRPKNKAARRAKKELRELKDIASSTANTSADTNVDTASVSSADTPVAQESPAAPYSEPKTNRTATDASDAAKTGKAAAAPAADVPLLSVLIGLATDAAGVVSDSAAVAYPMSALFLYALPYIAGLVGPSASSLLYVVYIAMFFVNGSAAFPRSANTSSSMPTVLIVFVVFGMLDLHNVAHFVTLNAPWRLLVAFALSFLRAGAVFTQPIALVAALHAVLAASPLADAAAVHAALACATMAALSPAASSLMLLTPKLKAS